MTLVLPVNYTIFCQGPPNEEKNYYYYYYHHFVRHCGTFYGLKCILACWNKPMKSENQIIVRCKQPIKIEKPSSDSAGERNILQAVLLSFFQGLFSQHPPK